MKILQIVPSYKPAYIYGGPIESVSKLCEGLVTAGHEVIVFTTTANGTTELSIEPNKSVLVDNVPVTYFKRNTKDPTHISFALWRKLYKNCRRFDIVHIHSWWNVLVIVAAVICHLRGTKVVISPRGMLSKYILMSSNSTIKRFIHSVVGKKALSNSRFHATSPIEYKECKELISGWQGFMLPNILTLPIIPIHKEEKTKFTLLFLSRIHPKKGLELLLDALAITSQNIILKIAGSGEENYLKEIKEKIKKLDIQEKVEWIGWIDREDKFIELMKADLFVLPSYNENFGNVVIESLHMGTPVLISNEVGLAPLIEKEGLGWTVSLDASAISEKIVMIEAAIRERSWIEVHSREIIRNLFSQDALISQYVQQYKSNSDK